MINLALMVAMFMPHTVVKEYPKPDPSCIYQWVSDASKLENKCEEPLVLDAAYKNGQGTHTILKKGEVFTFKSFPARVFVCTLGKGVPSASQDHMVHPGFKTGPYACIEQRLEFARFILK